MKTKEVAELNRLIRKAVALMRYDFRKIDPNYDSIAERCAKSIEVPTEFLERLVCTFEQTGDISDHIHLSSVLMDASYGHWIRKIVEYVKKTNPTVEKNETEKEESQKKHSFVYIATCSSTPDLYKIGKTNNLKTRESTLRCGNIYLTLEYTSLLFTEKEAYRLEKYLHQVFSDKKVDREWFQLTEEDLNLLTNLFSFTKSIGVKRDTFYYNEDAQFVIAENL